jgi:hypothetical protein
MIRRWIIEVVDGGQSAFICEHRGELYLTRRRAEATIYSTQLEAKCALVYITDRYQPRIIPVDESVPG